MAGVTLMAVLTAALPSVSGNEEFSAALARVLGRTPRLVAASYLAFVVAQAALIAVWSHTRPWPFAARLVVTACVMQAIDSLIFFPVAFAGTWWLSIALVGWTWKVALMLLMGPLLLLGAADNAEPVQ